MRSVPDNRRDGDRGGLKMNAIDEMYGWLVDCGIDVELIVDMSDDSLVMLIAEAVEFYFDGGVNAFMADLVGVTL